MIDDLLLARIDEKHLHVIAKPGTPMDDLPEATFAQKTDFVPAMQKGRRYGPHRLKRYEQAIESGQVLVLVDVPMERVQEIEARVRAQVPRAELEGTETRVPAFP